MRIEADLDVTLDSTSFHIGGDGDVVRVETADAASLVAALRGGGYLSRRRLAEIADRAADQGLSVELCDQRGRILTLGAAAHTGPLRLVTGTRHLAPASFRSSLLLARLAAGRGAVALTGAALAAATLALALRRRAGGPSRPS